MKTLLATVITLLSLTVTPSVAADDASPGIDPTPASSGALEPAPRTEPDPCLSREIVATPSRPVWTAGAQTTQCNVLEFDFGWLRMAIGSGMKQDLVPTSVRYGLTPRMDLRWGAPAPIVQDGSGSELIHGVSDESFSATYRFREQGRRMPAFALGYGVKEPHANPAKGFGTGYLDHQLVFIVSRDLGRAHVDCNTAGTVAGSAHGRDGGVFFGVVLSTPIARRLTWFIESEGGSQPGTPASYGAALNGLSWALRPWLVVDAACTQAYTAGTPRSQITVGLTYAHSSGFMPLSRGSRFARWLGR